MSLVDSVCKRLLLLSFFECRISSYTTDQPKAFELLSVSLFTILICCTTKKGVRTFIYIYYKSFDIHICSTRTGSFYVFCINRLKDLKVIGQRSWYIYIYI